VSDGEVRLAVAKVGWALVPGPLTGVRTSGHHLLCPVRAAAERAAWIDRA